MPGAARGEGNAGAAVNTERARGPPAGENVTMCLVLRQRVLPPGSALRGSAGYGRGAAKSTKRRGRVKQPFPIASICSQRKISPILACKLTHKLNMTFQLLTSL